MIANLQIENESHVNSVTELKSKLDESEKSKKWLNSQFVAKSIQVHDLEENIEKLKENLLAYSEHLITLKVKEKRKKQIYRFIFNNYIF